MRCVGARAGLRPAPTERAAGRRGSRNRHTLPILVPRLACRMSDHRRIVLCKGDDMHTKVASRRPVSASIAIGLLAALAAATPAQRAAAADAKPLPTLDGKPPLVIGHRGLP